MSREVLFTVGDCPMTLEADAAWKSFIESDENAKIEAASDAYFWMIQLPWIDQPEDVRRKFWSEFDKADCERARTVAAYGVKYANDDQLLRLLQLGREVSELVGRTDRRRSLAEFTGYEFAQLVAKRDPKVFRRMGEIISDNGIEIARDIEGDTKNRSLLRGLANLFGASRKLPEKAELRRIVTDLFPDDVDGKKKFSKAIKELGLCGLPEAKRGRKS